MGRHLSQRFAEQCGPQADTCERGIDTEHVELGLGGVALLHGLDPAEPGELALAFAARGVGEAQVVSGEPGLPRQRVEVCATHLALLGVARERGGIDAHPVVCLVCVTFGAGRVCPHLESLGQAPRSADRLIERCRVECESQQLAHGLELCASQQGRRRGVLAVRPGAQLGRGLVARKQRAQQRPADPFAALGRAHDEVELALADNADRIGLFEEPATPLGDGEQRLV